MVAPGPDDYYWLKRRIVVTSAGAFHLRAVASNALSFAFKFRVTLTRWASIDLEMRSVSPSSVALRHWYASALLLDAGVSLAGIMEFMGHSREGKPVTLGVYGHVTPETFQQARDAIDRNLFRLRPVRSIGTRTERRASG